MLVPEASPNRLCCYMKCLAVYCSLAGGKLADDGRIFDGKSAIDALYFVGPFTVF